MKKQFLTLILGGLTFLANAQNDPTVMKVNGKDIKKSEFEYLYKKNNTDISLNEYVELFKNFKLKVAEAESQGIDTTSAFKKELAENRKQLAQQYESKRVLNEALIRQEYERMNEDREISLLFIPMIENNTSSSPQILPADTLNVYNKAQQIRQRLIDGESFEKVGTEFANDKSNLFNGWLSATRMLYPIESTAYTTEIGKISQPVRINTGYILIKVLNKRPSRGEINAAHIMVMCQAGADSTQVEEASKKADQIYQRVMSGEDFATLAKELSDDKGSGQNGGDLSWFQTGQMVPEFENAAFGLQNIGDITQPVRSQFGFHIIKLLGKRGIPSYDDVKNNIITFFSRSEKYMDLYQPWWDQLKKKYKYVPNKVSEKNLYALASINFPSDSTFISKEANNKGVLFTLSAKPYTVADFITFLKKEGRSPFFLSTDFLKERLFAYETRALEKEEDSHLEDNYPEFRNLMKEYRDGFLSYEITQNEVWGKAPKDTVGLTSFFDKHKKDYTWDQPRYKGCVVLCKNDTIKNDITKMISGLSVDDAVDLIKTTYQNDKTNPVKIERGVFAQGSNQYVDEVIFKTKKADANTRYPEFYIMGKMIDQPESYSDVGGLIISDYQNYLEQEWINTLKAKYPIVLYPNILKTIK